MQAKRGGSAVVMVLLVITAITLMGAVALRSSNLAFDLTLDRVKYQKELHMVHALALYGIALSWHHYHAVDEKKREPHVVQLKNWPLPHGKYEGNVVFAPQEKQIHITAQLRKKDSSNRTIQCLIDAGSRAWRVVKWV